MDKKYQIFVSSTYEDLKEARNRVIASLFEAGHIPVGMEAFGAAPEESWEIIKQQIDRSDYYIVIVAHKYGSKRGELSYTELEYDYALAQKIPVLGFIIDENASWQRNLVDEGDDAERLTRFKAKIGSTRNISPWSSSEVLSTQVIAAISKAINSHKRPGWVRADEAVGPEVAKQLSRVFSENAELRQEIEAQKENVEQSDTNRMREILSLLVQKKYSVRTRANEGVSQVQGHASISLMIIFLTLSKNLIGIAPEYQLRAWLNEGIVLPENDVMWSPMINENVLKDFLADLEAVDLVESRGFRENENSGTPGDGHYYWRMSLFGRDVARWYRRDRLTRAAED